MSRTKRRTKTADYSCCHLTMYWGDHYMFDYKGRPKYESLQEMYDEEAAEVKENLRKYHSDLFRSNYKYCFVKDYVRNSGARSMGHQILHKAFVNQEFDDIDFTKEKLIHSRAKYCIY